MKVILGLAVLLIVALLAALVPSSNALVALPTDYTVETGVNGTLIYTVNPATPVSVIAQIVAGLKAGDTLQFAAGVYVNVALDLTGLLGSVDAWIIIRGIPCGTEYPVLQINTDVLLSANVLLGLGSSFIKVEGLVFSQIGSGLVNGIQFLSDASDIVLTNLVLNGINGIGIDISVDAVANVLIQHNILSNIGVLNIAENLGVGILVGGLLEPVTDVLNIKIVDNVIHDIFGNAGSAIQVLLGVVAPQVLDNVIWNAPLGLGVGLDVQVAVKVATGIADDVLANLPLVARNLIINTSGLNLGLGLTIALQIGAGSQCVNNIIVNADVGIDLILGGSLTIFVNTLIAHNTVFNITTCALRILDGLVSDTLRIVNNVLCIGLGLVGQVLQLVEGILGSVALILNNVVQGTLGVEITADLAGLIGTVDDLVGTVVDVVDEVVDVVDDVVDDVQDVVTGLEGTVGGLLNSVGSLLGNVLGTIGRRDVSTVNAKVLSAAAAGGMKFDLNKRINMPTRNAVKRGNYKGPLALIVVDDITDILDGVLDGVLKPLGPLLNNVVGDVNQVVDQVGRLVHVLLKDVIHIVNTLVTDLQKLLRQLGLGELADVLGNVKTLLDNLLSNLQETVDDLIDGVEDVLSEVGDLLENVVSDLDDVLVGVTDALDNLLGGLLGPNGLVDDLLGNLLGNLGKKRAATVNGKRLDLGGLLNGLLGGSSSGGLLGGVLGGDNGLLGGLLNLGGDGSGLLDVALGNVLGTVLGDLNNVLGSVLGAVDPLLSGVLGSVNDLLNNLLGDINNLLGGLLADVNLLLCHVLALVNSLLRSLLGGVIGNLHPLLGGILGPLDKILNGVLGGLLSGNLVLTAEVNDALNLVLADVNALLNAVLSDVDLLLADILGLVDFNGNVRVGRWTIGAIQAGVSLDLNVLLGFKSGVIVEVPCVQPTPGPSCPARRAAVSSTA